MIKFMDKYHKKFFNKKMMEAERYGKTDVYYKSLIYTLSICESTREHFEEIFDIKTSEINLDCIHTSWQTSTSMKVTRMALNLWNHSLMYDSEEDLEKEVISEHYAPSEIFCCSYAPYFYEAIKIRYPEYANYEHFEHIITNKEIMENNVEEEIY